MSYILNTIREAQDHSYEICRGRGWDDMVDVYVRNLADPNYIYSGRQLLKGRNLDPEGLDKHWAEWQLLTPVTGDFQNYRTGHTNGTYLLSADLEKAGIRDVRPSVWPIFFDWDVIFKLAKSRGTTDREGYLRRLFPAKSISGYDEILDTIHFKYISTNDEAVNMLRLYYHIDSEGKSVFAGCWMECPAGLTQEFFWGKSGK